MDRIFGGSRCAVTVRAAVHIGPRGLPVEEVPAPLFPVHGRSPTGGTFSPQLTSRDGIWGDAGVIAPTGGSAAGTSRLASFSRSCGPPSCRRSASTTCEVAITPSIATAMPCRPCRPRRWAASARSWAACRSMRQRSATSQRRQPTCGSTTRPALPWTGDFGTAYRIPRCRGGGDLLHFGAARRRFWWSDTGGTSALGTWTWARAPATSWNEPVCLLTAPSPSSIPT